MRKKVNRRGRQIAKRAAQSFAAVKDSAAVQNPGADAPLVRAILSAESASYALQQHQRNHVVRWSDAGPLAQLTLGCRAAVELAGGGLHSYSWNLLLSPDIQRHALANPRWLRRRIVRYVGQHVPLVMTLGYSQAGVLHLHGAVAVMGAVTAPADDLERITAALEAAGGEWAADRGDQHQLVMESFVAAASRLSEKHGRHVSVDEAVDGWGKYLNDNRLQAEPVTGRGRVWSMTKPALHEAQAQYDDLRQRINAADRGQEDNMHVSALTRERMEWALAGAELSL